MWYFSWILGLGLALCFGVLNAIWYELVDDQRALHDPGASGVSSRKGSPEGSPQQPAADRPQSSAAGPPQG